MYILRIYLLLPLHPSTCSLTSFKIALQLSYLSCGHPSGALGWASIVFPIVFLKRLRRFSQFTPEFLTNLTISSIPHIFLKTFIVPWRHIGFNVGIISHRPIDVTCSSNMDPEKVDAGQFRWNHQPNIAV